jgi:hypothetical protein
MLLKWIILGVFGFYVTKWFFRDSLRTFLGALDKKVNRVVNAALIALLLVYSLRLVLLWLGIPDWMP